MLPAKLAGRKVDRAWFDHVVDTVGLASATPPPAVRALGRPAATRRRRPGARRTTTDHLRRRTDRQPRFAEQQRSAVVHAGRRPRVRPDDRDGHPRPGRRLVRRPGRLPRRRPDRRRHRRTRPRIPSSTRCAPSEADHVRTHTSKSSSPASDGCSAPSSRCSSVSCLMAGTLVFTDTMLAAGDNVLEDAHAGVDAMVRAPSDVDVAYGQVGTRMDADVIDTVRHVDGRRPRRGPGDRLRPTRGRRR